MSFDKQSLRHVALAALLAVGLSPSANAQRVVRDAQTGALRAPTAAEIRSMEGAGARKASTPVGLLSGRANPQPVTLANGTVSQELTTEHLMYSVARRNPDGSISQYCVSGEESANAVLKGKAQSKPRSFAKSSKEQAHEVK